MAYLQSALQSLSELKRPNSQVTGVTDLLQEPHALHEGKLPGCETEGQKTTAFLLPNLQCIINGQLQPTNFWLVLKAWLQIAQI